MCGELEGAGGGFGSSRARKETQVGGETSGPPRELVLAPEDGGDRLGLGVLPSGWAPPLESALCPCCGQGCLTHIWDPS